ncbi:MAG TPA: hypothetical protein VHY91_17390 [Pirellulales bacterium]|nr:hypothetical protein [Pirellulales bacterium]
MESIIYVVWPLIVACIGLAIWKLVYVGRRPLTPKVKVIVVVILVWSSLPMMGWFGIYLLAAMGGHMGD